MQKIISKIHLRVPISQFTLYDPVGYFFIDLCLLDSGLMEYGVLDDLVQVLQNEVPNQWAVFAQFLKVATREQKEIQSKRLFLFQVQSITYSIL